MKPKPLKGLRRRRREGTELLSASEVANSFRVECNKKWGQAIPSPEIMRRIDEIDAGKVPGIDAFEALESK
jgi:hypothetical protein